jgi:hypothetical protein
VFDAEFLPVAIKYQVFTSGKVNLPPRAVAFGMRDVVNEGMAFKHCVPHDREIVSVLH